jgi:hypothetical protein
MSEPHVMSALKAKRAEVAGQLSDAEKVVARLRAALANLDAAMNILTPDHPDHIAPRSRHVRANYFAPNELPRLVRQQLRDAPTPLTPSQIVANILAAKGLPDSLQDTVTGMVRSTLGILGRRGEFTKTGRTKNAKWAVAAQCELI